MTVNVPDTETFTLQQVVDIIRFHAPGTSYDLVSAFANANSAYFHRNGEIYPANSLLRFRNYTVPI